MDSYPYSTFTFPGFCPAMELVILTVSPASALCLSAVALPLITMAYPFSMKTAFRVIVLPGIFSVQVPSALAFSSTVLFSSVPFSVVSK